MADSMAIAKQVDSLIQISRTLTDKKDFDKALEVNAAAEKLALEKLGRETAAYGSVCNNYGRVLFAKRDYPGMEKWTLEAMAIREKVLGKEHADYAVSLYNLGLANHRMGNFAKAQAYHLEAKEIRSKVLGKEDPYYAASLYNLGMLCNEMGTYDEAEQYFLEAKEIQAKALGRENSEYVATLGRLATLYFNQGKYEQSERLNLDVKDIREKMTGKESPQYAQSLNNLASLYMATGQFDLAEQYYLEARAIREKTVGKEDKDYAASLGNLGILYAQTSRYEQAVPLFLEAQTIREKALGKAHPDYIEGLLNLATLSTEMGDFEHAEWYYLEAMAFQEKVLGKEHPTYAVNLGNLSILYNEMGNHEREKILCLEAQTILEKTLGKEHPDYASGLDALAVVYMNSGDLAKAEPLCREALAIRKKVLGTEHPHYVLSITHLATIYERMGKYSEAEPIFLEALSIVDRTLGKEHSSYAYSLNDLAYLYDLTGRFEKAEPLLLEAKNVREKTLGKSHPGYAWSLTSVANLYFKTGRFSQALAHYSEAATLRESLIYKALHHLSERELNKYLQLLSGHQASLLSLARHFPAASPTAYNNTLFYKGFLLQAYNQIRRLALADSATAYKLILLKSYERRLAAEYARPVSEQNSVAELEEQALDLEKDLARSVDGYGDAMRQVRWQEVQQNLKPGEAAVEFVHYRLYGKTETDSMLYGALVLRPGWSQPRMVSLFEHRDIQPLLAAANNTATAGHLYGSGGAETSLRKAGRGNREEGIVIPAKKTAGLYQLVWAPLDSLLYDATTVYFAPSGLLHRLHLGAIPVPGGPNTLADRYNLVQVGSTRQLAVRDGAAKTPGRTAVLFGGLRYEAEKPAEVPDSTRQNRPDYNVAALRNTLGGRGDQAWNYLPGTEKEVKDISRTLGKAGYPARALGGHDGSEAAFKALGKNGDAPAVLHIATHGFFFADPRDTTRRRDWHENDPVFKISDNPLLRSGLILAGANPAWAGGQTPEGREDGILTAYEISQMDLRGTELVVLSACETGLGDVEDNEGVYGLKRAFKIAGVRYLIMSLWQVPDRQTQELMSTFYRNWLQKKMAIPEAFAAAQRTMRRRYDDPTMWAGFILVE